MVQKLQGVDEYLAGRGANKRKTLIFELWRTVDNKTWSVIRVDQRNTACLVLHGIGWVPFEVIPGEDM